MLSIYVLDPFGAFVSSVKTLTVLGPTILVIPEDLIGKLFEPPHNMIYSYKYYSRLLSSPYVLRFTSDGVMLTHDGTINEDLTFVLSQVEPIVPLVKG